MNLIASSRATRTLSRVTLAALGLIVILLSGAGCTRGARIARHLSRGDRYMQAADYDKAEIEYAIVLRLNSSEPRALSNLGMIFFDEGRLSLAASFLPKARAVAPENVPVRLRLAMLDLMTGRFDDARAECLYVLQHQPNDEDLPFVIADTARQPKEFATLRTQLLQSQPDAHPTALIALGLVDLREQKLADAEAHFSAAQKKLPTSPALTFALAQLYAAQKDMARASEAFARAAAASPPWSPRQLRRVRFLIQNGKLDDAKRVLVELTTKTPSVLPPWMLLAGIAYDEKKYDDALKYVRKVLARDALNHDALILQARATFAKGDRSGSISLLERMTKLFPKSPEPQLQLATYQWSTGDGDAAATTLNGVLTLAPNLPAAVLLLAEIDLRRGRVAEATAALKSFVQQQPANGAARLLLAQAYRIQGNLDQALVVYRQIESSFTGTPQPAYLTGTLLIQQKRYSEARQALERALKISPTFLPAFEQLVNIDLLEKQPAVAKGRVKAKLVQEPNTAAYHLLLAKIHLFAGESGEAEKALEKVVELQPESPLGYYLLGQLYLQTNQTPKALERLQQSVAKNRHNLPAIVLIASIDEQQGNYAAARQYYEMALAVDPKLPVALNNLAYLLAEKLNDVEKGFELAQRAREQLPHEPNVADTLGWIVFRKQQYPWALTLLTEASEQLPASPDVHYHLGMAHYMLGHEQAARDILERAIALDAKASFIADARDALSVLASDDRAVDAGRQQQLEQRLGRSPDDPVALAHLGVWHEQRGDLESARRSYDAALKVSPNNLTAALGTIRLRLARQETAAALELARKTHQLNPDNAAATHLLGRAAFVAGNFPWSLSLLQESARQLSSDPVVQWDLALAAYSTGRVDDAKRAAQAALTATPPPRQATAAREFLAMIALAGDPAAASAESARIAGALATNPADVPALMALAAVQEQKSDWAAAAATYQKALAAYPEFSPAQRNFALAAARGASVDAKAIAAAVKAHTAYPNDAVLAKALGILSYRNADYTRARAALQDALRDAEEAEGLYYLGLTQGKLKDRSASDRSLRRALELGLTAEQAGNARKLLDEHAREKKATAATHP